MMITKWKVEKWGSEPIAVQCLSETEKTVVLSERGRRAKKRSEYARYFDTFEEAREFLRDRLRTSIRRAQSTLEHDREALAKLDAMQPPQERT